MNCRIKCHMRHNVSMKLPWRPSATPQGWKITTARKRKKIMPKHRAIITQTTASTSALPDKSPSPSAQTSTASGPLPSTPFNLIGRDPRQPLQPPLHLLLLWVLLLLLRKQAAGATLLAAVVRASAMVRVIMSSSQIIGRALSRGPRLLEDVGRIARRAVQQLLLYIPVLVAR